MPIEQHEISKLPKARRRQLTGFLRQAGLRPEEIPDILKTYQRHQGVVFFETDKKRVKGYAITTNTGTDIRFDAAHTSPPFRRQGVFTRLVDAVINYAQQIGAHAINLETSPEAPQNSIYRQRGFTGRSTSRSIHFTKQLK